MGWLADGIGGHRIPPVSVSVVSEPGGGRDRPGQTMSDLEGAITDRVRAVSAVASLSFGAALPGERRLGGSAASLPVRGFIWSYCQFHASRRPNGEGQMAGGRPPIGTGGLGQVARRAVRIKAAMTVRWRSGKDKSIAQHLIHLKAPCAAGGAGCRGIRATEEIERHDNDDHAVERRNHDRSTRRAGAHQRCQSIRADAGGACAAGGDRGDVGAYFGTDALRPRRPMNGSPGAPGLLVIPGDDESGTTT